MHDFSKLIASAMKIMEKSEEKDATLIVLRELKTKESLLREPMTAEIQYNWLKKMKKEREDSMHTYVNNGRKDLAQKEFFELVRINEMMTILTAELPKQMSKDEIIAIFNKEKFATIKDCMMYFSKIKGCDKKLVSEVFREINK